MMLLLNHQERKSCFFFFRIERGEADILLVSSGYKGRVLIRYASIWDARPFFTDRTGHRVGGQAILSLFTHTDTAW
jgi:hypothetical protein